MSNLPAKQEYTEEQIERVKAVTAAEEFCKRFYPGLWNRIREDDMLQILTLAHTVFKTNPEYLEATTQPRRTPTQ